ncbi:hypothetical protein C8F04DRAFT_1139610 [Mycena alexandri]|uniref:G-protein coupled receptors family 2 profile 2 domain-containing protein n=1 Tax=Mycena alexandri TaxID=1745969 RepID=A0AAD6S761_9AGAR|nr:hypothetical protein C8F04DRAFT_1139610 [Mycena alexandri]
MSPRLHTPTTFDSHIPDLIIAFAAAAVAFISSILAAYAWTAYNPVSRPYLNRVSFRLLIYALVANLANVACQFVIVKSGPGAACNGILFLANVSYMFSGVMFFCMALNLQLVLVHGVNGQNMEKYYILGAVVLPLACAIPPYAAGAFGYWAVNDTCWYNSPNPAVQLRWWVGTLGLWMFLMSAGEVASFVVIVGSMIIRHRVISAVSTGASTLSSITPLPLPQSPIVAYRSIILRIGLYPVVSCFFSFTGGFLDLWTITNTAETETNWRLGIVDLMVYTLRPIAYALLAATDPSFLRALRALRGSESEQGNLYARTWRSSAPSSPGRPSMKSDTEIGRNSIKAEDGNETDESFTCQI